MKVPNMKGTGFRQGGAETGILNEVDLQPKSLPRILLEKIEDPIQRRKEEIYRELQEEGLKRSLGEG